MDKVYFILGVALAAVLLIVALLATVLAYLTYCSKHPTRKFRAEVFVVAAVTLASLAVRMVIGYAALPDSGLQGGVTSFFHGFFSAIAGLTFNSLLELGDMAGGVLTCLYYGVIVYASLVFLVVITVGLSYEFYSRVQMRGLRRRYCTYYIITAITQDSLLLAEDIKAKKTEENRTLKKKHRHKFAIIFFIDGQESFSRKDPLHRRIMENGFYFYSDFRRNDKGEVVSFLQTFKFRKKDCAGDDCGAERNKLFNVFAVGDCGGFEGDNAQLVFDDLNAVLKKYVKRTAAGVTVNVPTTVNYHLLTGGEINYESYDRRLNEALEAHFKALDLTGKERDAVYNECICRLQVNVFNEATLSSQDLVGRRKYSLAQKGTGAFFCDSAPDGDGAYRIAVIGFGKTGQYAMEELYINTAHLIKAEGCAYAYKPVQFIADIFDVTCDDKSGPFAYNHPLFRCINAEDGGLCSTKDIITKAEEIESCALSGLYAGYKKRSGATEKECKKFIDDAMALPIAVFHSESCFKFPFMDGTSGDVALSEAKEKGIRDFVVALGDDERNIAMANLLIDAFKRAYHTGGGAKRHVTIYVNLIEATSRVRLNWSKEDETVYSQNFEVTGGVAKKEPYLSVVTFGERGQMFSCGTLVDDYAARLYNYGYGKYSARLYCKGYEEASKSEQAAKQFVDELKGDYGKYKGAEDVSDGWLFIKPFTRKSNDSAHDFAINYYDYKKMNGEITEQDMDFLARVEHERWNRFHIANGWIYGDYSRNDKKIKSFFRSMKQHDCLCPYDVMLDEDTKKYDVINCELGFIEGVVFGENRAIAPDICHDEAKISPEEENKA